MDPIIELAEKLGKAIAESTPATKLRQSRKALEAEPEITQCLKDFHVQSDKLAKLEAENKSIEVDDKHELQELHDKLIASELFKNLTAAQMEYIDFMRKVNNALQKQLGETEKE